jgi:cobalt-zinc-cadmium efflux system outer membrane protein
MKSFSQGDYTLEEAEKQFLSKNLFLIANQYNIQAAKALTIQAAIWENPYFLGELNAINPQDKRYGDVGANGEKVFALEQVIYLGGKKKNEIALARSNEKIAELDFQDLLRTLKFEIRKSFYAIYFNNKKLESNDRQIANIDSLVKSYSIQAQNGNIPLKELVRLQSLLLNFRNARIEIVNDNIEQQNTLKVLLNENGEISPKLSENLFDKFILKTLPDRQVLDSIALENRPDYKLVLANIESKEWNLKWQKSLAVPDLKLGGSYDQRGGAFNNQVNLTFGIPLPLWDRNQGNIKFAKSVLDQSKVEQQVAALKVKTEVAANLQKWFEAKNNYSNLTNTTIADFEAVYKGVLANFQKRNISILEFTDFMESYNQMSIQLNEFKKNIVVSGEELNTTLNSAIF